MRATVRTEKFETGTETGGRRAHPAALLFLLLLIAGPGSLPAWTQTGTASPRTSPRTPLRPALPPARGHVGQAPSSTSSAPSPEAIEGLLSLAGQAPVIFAGEVASVTRADDRGFVDIEFAIRHAVRGCPPAGTYVLREWAGLWSGGVARYTPGQRLLLLLAARGPSGMSAPVGGQDGAIPLIPAGDPPLLSSIGVPSPDAGDLQSAPAADDILRAGVDLRWVETHAQRLVKPASGAHPAAVRQDVAAEGASELELGSASGPALEPGLGLGWVGPARPIHRTGSIGDVGVTPPTLRAVLALLGPAVAEAHAAHR